MSRCRHTDPTRPWAAFQLLTPDAAGLRSFDPRQGVVVAGMVRHALAGAARDAGGPEDEINRCVLGHGPDRPAKETEGPQLVYVPLPTINRHGVSGIRRALVAGPVGGGALIERVRRILSGRELIDEGTKQPAALVSLTAASDPVVRRYTGSSPEWCTVTPVVPGHDDGNANKVARLLRKAIRQGGLSETLAEQADIEFRCVGFLPGLDLATRYRTPDHLQRASKVHVCVRWRDASGGPISVDGPLLLGGGRFCGLGLFVARSSGDGGNGSR